MQRIAVYGKDTHGKKHIITQLRALKRHELVTSTSSVESFLMFSDGKKQPFYLANLQILVLDLSNETLESLLSMKQNYHPCDFKRPLMLLVYGKNEVLYESLQLNLKPPVILHAIDNLDAIQPDTLLDELDALGAQFYSTKAHGVLLNR